MGRRNAAPTRHGGPSRRLSWRWRHQESRRLKRATKDRALNGTCKHPFRTAASGRGSDRLTPIRYGNGSHRLERSRVTFPTHHLSPARLGSATIRPECSALSGGGQHPEGAHRISPCVPPGPKIFPQYLSYASAHIRGIFGSLIPPAPEKWLSLGRERHHSWSDS